MARPTETARVIVLRKTKLGEADLVLTMLGESGSQLRAVAKGARKPSSTFAARLELYSVCDVLVAQGSSLGIVKEARIVESNDRARRDLEHAACAAVMAELLDRTTQDALDVEKLFPATRKALSVLCASDADRAPAIAAAHCLKTFAYLGVRPELDSCCRCGRPSDGAGRMWFSAREGGTVCDSCRFEAAGVEVDPSDIAWMRAFLHLPFDEVAKLEGSLSPAFSALAVVRQWTREHFGFTLRSVDFLRTSGLFE